MKAVIMAGGFGTRLRPLTNNIPKPMIPMANKPIMEHIVELLKEHGITEMVSLLYFQPEVIEGYFRDGSDFGVKMSYVTPGEDYGTAGSVKNAEAFLRESFLIISGDLLTDFDLRTAIRFHRERGALATIVLTRVENPLQYGVVIADEEGRINRFLEKPTWSEVFSDTVNTGIYILEPEALDFVPAKREFDFSKDLFPLLLQEGQALYGYVAPGYWKDVGDLFEYRLAHRDILSGLVKVKMPGRKVGEIDKDIWLDEGCRVDFTAALRGSVLIGKNSRVEANTRIANSVIGDGCIIEEGASITDSILWDRVYVGRGAILKENVVGRGSEIKAYARLFEGALISDNCKIGEASIVKANVKVWPHKVVEDGATLAASLVWGERWSKSIFGAHGVVGLANIEISPEFAAKLGASFGASLREGAIVRTSRDHHKISRMINRAIICGLLSAGLDVHDFRVTPIPVVRYKMGVQGAVGGVHVRKSPYDPELIDIKFFDERGLDLPSGKEKSVERLFFREDFRRASVEGTGRLSFPEHGIEYYHEGLLHFVKKDLIRQARLKVVIDYSYGSSSTIFPPVLGELGCEVIALNAYMDESKITKTTEEFQRSWKQLSEIVRILGADLGIMMDTGAEKIFLVDEKGDVVPDDLALALVSLLVLKTHDKGAIGVPVTASSVLDDLARGYGFRVIRTKTAPKALMEAATQEGMIFVGDGVGGFVFPGFQPAFDGMLATLKILEMLAATEARLHQLLRSVPERFILKAQIPCPWEFKGTIMRRLIEDTQGEQVELIDGVKVFYGSDWVILYPDQDKPLFNVIAEAAERSRAEELLSRFKEKVRSWQQEAA
ncbi:MAG: mannose-1-phosphate guanyltransferase [candidate division NC10 bacterium]|nr:mannose-1-phosphate guanyltransferase [candidate division NC10 bacterium]